MKLNKLLKIIDGKYINNLRCSKPILGFEFNTKNLTENDVFISINDGYKYVNDDTKCIAIITDKVIDNINKPIIIVGNVNEALVKIAKYKRKKYKDMKIIGITGSVGKTTTKELLYNILSTKYKVYKNKLNYNNHIGLPYTLANINDNFDYCILEMGMNHSGEINYLTEICKPNIAIITNIGTSHIGNFNSLDELIHAKLEITNNLSGPLFIDESFNSYTNYQNIINYQKYKIDNIDLKLDKTIFNILIDNNQYLITLNIPAIHLIPNIINSINVAKYLNIDNDSIIKAINEFSMPDNRIKIYQEDFILIDDTYNASFESITGIIDSIKNINIEKIIILGDILELGKFSTEIHNKLNNYLKDIDAKILLVGKETKVIDGVHFESNSQLIEYLTNMDLHNKLILIKGSHAMKLEETVNALIS